MNKFAFSTIVLTIVLTFGLIACTPPAESGDANTPAPSGTEEKPADEGSTSSTSTETGATEPPAYMVDGKLTCPVMGASIESKEKAVGYQDHEGTRYYFCCDMCPDAFKKEPDKYVKKEGVASPAPAGS